MQFQIRRFIDVAVAVSFCLANGCNSKPDSVPYHPDSSESSTGNKTDSAQSGSAIADSIREQSRRISPSMPEINLPDSKEDLFRYLAQQSYLQRNSTEPAELLRIQLDKLSAANKLLKNKLDDNQRFIAVQAKLDALIRLISLGNNGSRQEFFSFAISLESDANSRIQQIAAVAQIVGELNERLSKKESNIDSVIEQACAVARRFPESADVCIELYNQCELVAKNGTREQVIKLLESLAGVYQNNNDARIRSVVAIMNTRIELAKLNLDLIFNQIRDGQIDAMPELKSSLESLCADELLTWLTLERIDNSVNWLEMEQRFEAAGKVNQVLLDVVESVQDDRFQSQMRDLCLRRQVRIDLLGQLLPDNLPLANKSLFDRSQLVDRNTIVLFWSPSEPASVDLLKQLAELRDKQAAPQWELLGVCLTRNSDVVRTLFGGAIPAWPNITITDDSASLADRFGVLEMPHVMMLDDQHRFISTTFPLTRLIQQLEKWSGHADATQQQ